MYRHISFVKPEPIKHLQPSGLEFDGDGIEIRRYQAGHRTLFQTFCICSAHQLYPGSKSAAYRWRKLHWQRTSCGHERGD